MYKTAERFCGYTQDGVDTDGIIKDGKDIVLSVIFKTVDNMNHFESEILSHMSALSGYKRPLVDADVDSVPHEIVLLNRTTQVVLAEPSAFSRIYQHQYIHDRGNNDPDNSADCDIYSDVTSTYSRAEGVNIDDPEVRAQMIEDPHHPSWIHMNPQAAHIKDKAKCKRDEKTDPNNIINMSAALHAYFDGLNTRPPKFPAMKIRFISRDPRPIQCPVEDGERKLGLKPRYRVTVQVVAWNALIKVQTIDTLRPGGITIDALTYQLDMYFLDGAKAEVYLKWKEHQTEEAWKLQREGVPAGEIAVQLGIGEPATDEAEGAAVREEEDNDI
jgi:hypothetical protein